MSDKPGKVFNLDGLEREGEVPEPFNFTVNGKRFQVDDVESHDWQDLVAVDADDPSSALRGILGAEDYERLVAIRGVPMWKLTQLLDAITAHFGLGESGESDASSGS